MILLPKFITERFLYLIFRQNKEFYRRLFYWFIALVISILVFLPIFIHLEFYTPKYVFDPETNTFYEPKIEKLIKALTFGIPFLITANIIVYSLICVWQIFKISTKFTSKKKLKAVSSFIKTLNEPGSYYCFIMRPFGGDECLLVEGEGIKFKEKSVSLVELSENPYMYIAKYLKFPIPIEGIIADLALNNLGSETICLADPTMKIFPKSVTYLLAEESDWKDAIDTILRKTLVAVLICQPKTFIGQSTKWETELAINLGLLDRLIIILPSPNSPDYFKAYESLLSLRDILPLVLNLPKVVLNLPKEEKNQFSISPEQICDKPIIVYLNKTEINWFYGFNSEDYSKAISQTFKIIEDNLSQMRAVSNLYPYWNANLIEEFCKKHNII